ncbi:MAG: hypothetical protein ACREUT_09565 [Steroidobacteraceae bacterium]
MPYERSATRLPDELHRYFPEWADRPGSADSLLEADHNSYLAGGYSEEFGYRVHPDRPPVFPLLFEDPERSRQWTVQIGCLHPGYPECPRPAARGADRALAGEGRPRQLHTGMSSADRGSLSAGEAGPVELVRVLRVNRRRLERGVLQPIVALRARLRIRRSVRDRGI